MSFRSAALDELVALFSAEHTARQADRAAWAKAREDARAKDKALEVAQAKPSGSLWGRYFWTRAEFDIGALCGLAAFGAAWWFFLKKTAT
jgi:hypothetical protein